MARWVKIPVENQDPEASFLGFLQSVLNLEEISGVFTQQAAEETDMPMPVLAAEKEALAACAPLAPAFSMNAAKMLSRLTRKPGGHQVAAVLRPCELRAHVELVKFHQSRSDELVLMGFDCPGAYTNADYSALAKAGGKRPGGSLADRMDPHAGAGPDGPQIAEACRCCVHLEPMSSDLHLALWGCDLQTGLMIFSRTQKGDRLLDQLGLEACEAPPGREEALAQVLKTRRENREKMLAETREQTDSLEKLEQYLSQCISCGNCRVACPICYCRQCVFNTDAVAMEPDRYIRLAQQKGAVRMPDEALFYHLTRMAHMSLSCVACGQCSNACPNSVPVFELMANAADKAQAAFSYEPGKDGEEKPPLTQWREDELEDVVGLGT